MIRRAVCKSDIYDLNVALIEQGTGWCGQFMEDHVGFSWSKSIYAIKLLMNLLLVLCW